MNRLNEKKNQLEKEIEDELRKIEKLREELRERKERVESLQRELKEISEQVKKTKGKGKTNENAKEAPKRNKRKNTEEFINKKKKRAKMFQEELMNEDTDEEVEEEDIQQEELITLFKKAYKYEIKKNRKMIEYWCNYAIKFKERVEEIMTDSGEERKTAISIVYKEIREQLPNLSK